MNWPEHLIRASRESFGHEPEPFEARPVSAWLVMALAAATVLAQLGIIGLIVWRMW